MKELDFVLNEEGIRYRVGGGLAKCVVEQYSLRPEMIVRLSTRLEIKA